MLEESFRSLWWVRAVFGLAVAAVLAGVGLWAGLFAMFGTFFFLLSWASLWAWFAVSTSWLPLLLAVLLPVLTIPLAWVPPWEFVRSQDDLMARLEHDGVDGLPEPQLYALLGAHRAMATAAGLVGLPELGEMLAAMHEGSRLYDRKFHGNFAMRSPLVRRAVRSLVAEARPGSGGARLEEAELAWDHRLSLADSYRVAMALDCPSKVSGSVWAKEGRLLARLSARCVVTWPERQLVQLGSLNGVPVGFELGLFRALIDRGWLESYQADWRWEIDGDDPLFEDGALVLRDRRDAWLQELLVGLGL